MSPPMIAALMLLAVLAMIGSALLGWAITTGRRARRAAAWPVVMAHVTRSRRSRDAEGDAVPRIEVSYQVGGRRHLAVDPWFGTTPTGNDATSAMLHRFPEGCTVPLHYDPSAPSRATLLPDRRAGTALATMIGATFVLVSAGTAWLICI